MKNNPRQGLRIRGHNGHPVVRRAYIRFAKWLRTQYEFPIRVPVYLFPSDYIIDMNGQKISASFFAPFSRNEEPFIRIATGDYISLRKELGRDNALAAFLCSFAHEVIHYQQWITTGNTWERGVYKMATGIIRKYEKYTTRP
jgi:hypothetical protein